jgi:uncharacterized protein (DUF433 family)
MRAYLKRIHRDVKGVPIKLYPLRNEDTGKTDAPTPIEIDPRVAFGRPVLIGRAVPTGVLADRFKAGDSIEALAGDFEVTPAAIQEPDVVHALLTEARRFPDEHRHGSPPPG